MNFLKRKHRGVESRDVLIVFIAIVLIGLFFIANINEQPNVVQGSQKIVQTVSQQYTYLLTTQTISGTKYYYSWNSNSVLAFGGTGNINLGIDVGSNFSAVIQNTINSQRGKCGVIALAPQIFNATHGFTMYTCMGLVGLAGNGDFSIEPNTTLIASTDCTRPVITIEVDPLHTNFVVFPALSGLSLVGKGVCATTQDGIFITNVNGVILDAYMSYVRIFGMGGNCLNLSTTNMKLWLDNMYFEDCNQNGITGQANIFLSSSYIFGNALYGINHISGGLLNSFHDWFLQDVQGALFCANVNNQCNSQDDTVQNNGGTSFAQMTLSTSANPTANPIVIQGDTFTDSRTSGQAFAQIRMGATQVLASIESNYFWSAKNVNCFSFVGGGFISGGSLANVIISGNQGVCNNVVGNISGNFLIGGTSATTTHFIGAFGMNSTTIIKSQNYVAANTNLYIACSGGTGVIISIIDPLGNIFSTYPTGCPTQAIELPIGYKINFGGFSVIPTVNVLVKSI